MAWKPIVIVQSDVGVKSVAEIAKAEAKPASSPLEPHENSIKRSSDGMRV